MRDRGDRYGDQQMPCHCIFALFEDFSFIYSFSVLIFIWSLHCNSFRAHSFISLLHIETSTLCVPYYLGKYPDQNVRMLSHARHKTITKRRTRWLVPSSPARRSHAASRLFIAFKIFFDCSLITSLIIAIICMLYLFSQHVVPALTKCRLARHNS